MKHNIKYILASSIAVLALQAGCANDGVDSNTECDVHNVCGGCAALSQNTGDACGVCGTYVCDGPNAVKCKESGASKNACGSCGELAHQPGESCEDGVWTCTTDGSIECKVSNVEKNACGGTVKLDLYGKPCGSCGSYVCDGTDALKCADLPKNSCGGCNILNYAPGDACENGVWSCNDGDLKCIVTVEDGEKNACGGTAVIGEIGIACGECGITECAGQNAVKCVDSGKNACGGCETLTGFEAGKGIGDSCGDCGKYTCTTINSFECNDPGKNGCGGCIPLVAKPNTKCGDGECAIWTCTGENSMSCGSPNANACGGCGQIDHAPGEKCESDLGCCTWECDENGGIYKDEHAPNACGGCGELDAYGKKGFKPGDPCLDNFGTWQCETRWGNNNDLTCVCDEKNECGGCALGHRPGAECKTCEAFFEETRGEYVCRNHELICDNGFDTPENARGYAYDYSGSAIPDSNDEWLSQFGTFIYEDSVHYFRLEAEDKASGIMQPEFYMGSTVHEFCVYIHEYRNDPSVKYKNEGSTTIKISGAPTESLVVSAYTEDTLMFNGLKYQGFCTTDNNTNDGTKYIRFTGVETLGDDNSLSVFVRIRKMPGIDYSIACKETMFHFRF